jgi:hypothetical protein
MCSLSSIAAPAPAREMTSTLLVKQKGLNLSITLAPDFIDLYAAKLLFSSILADTLTER